MREESLVSQAMNGGLKGTLAGSDAAWNRYRRERKHVQAAGEDVEAELEAFVARRSEQGRESVAQREERDYQQRRMRREEAEREANRMGWIIWYRHIRQGCLRRVEECDRLLHELGDRETA